MRGHFKGYGPYTNPNCHSGAHRNACSSQYPHQLPISLTISGHSLVQRMIMMKYSRRRLMSMGGGKLDVQFLWMIWQQRNLLGGGGFNVLSIHALARWQ